MNSKKNVSIYIKLPTLLIWSMCWVNTGCSSKSIILSSPPVLSSRGEWSNGHFISHLNLNNNIHKVKIRTVTNHSSPLPNGRDDLMFFQIEELDDHLDRVEIVIFFEDRIPSDVDSNTIIYKEKVAKRIIFNIDKTKDMYIIKHLKYACERVGYIPDGYIKDHVTVVAAKMDDFLYGGYIYKSDNPENKEWKSKFDNFCMSIYDLSLIGDEESISKIKKLLERPLERPKP